MINRLAAWLNGHASARWIWGLLAVFVILTALFPVLYAQMESNAILIDGQFGTTVEETFTLLEELGPGDRSWYAAGELTLDLAYPVVYSSLLALLLTRSLPAAFPRVELLQRLRLLPFGAGLFDLLENFSIVALIAAHPARWIGLARLLSVFNQTKWILLALSLGLLTLTAVLAGLRRLGGRD